MKRLFCVVFIFIFLFSIKLSAKEILIVKETTADFGEGETLYDEIEDFDYLGDHYEVIEEADLKKGIIVKNSRKIMHFDEVIKLKGKEGLAVVRKDKDYYFLDLDTLGTYYLNSKDTYFKDFCYDEAMQAFFVVGERYVDAKSSITISLINKHGMILYSTSYEGNGINKAQYIFSDSDYIYVIGTTTSIDLDFEHQGLGEDSYVLKIKKRNYQIDTYYDLGLAGIDNIEAVYLDEQNNLYILQSYYKYNLLNYRLHLIGDSSKYLDLGIPERTTYKTILFNDDIIDLYLNSNQTNYHLQIANDLKTYHQSTNLIPFYSSDYFERGEYDTYFLYQNDDASFKIEKKNQIIFDSDDLLGIDLANSVVINYYLIYFNDNLYINFNKRKPTPDSIYQEDYELFGSYFEKLIYEEEIDLYYDYYHKIPLITNLYNKARILKGTNVYANAIYDKELLADVGKVNVTFKGYNLADIIYEVEIIDDEFVDYKEEDAEIIRIEEGVEKESSQIGNIQNNLIRKNYYQNLWTILFPITTFSACFLIYFVMKRKFL